jgi:hypothetical protein
MISVKWASAGIIAIGIGFLALALYQLASQGKNDGVTITLGVILTLGGFIYRALRGEET